MISLCTVEFKNIWVVSAMKEFFEIINEELIKYNGFDTDIVIPKVKAIHKSAFYLNNTAVNIVLSDGIEVVNSWAFGYCTALKKVLIPASVKEIAPSAFDGCLLLEEIIVSKDNKYFSSKNGVLFDKSKKKLILFPRGSKRKTYTVPASVEEICDNSFNRCFNLEKVNISESVLSIGYKAFAYCTRLKSVFLSKSIKRIGYCAFASATSVKQFVVDEENKAFKSIQGVLFDITGQKLIQFPLGKRSESFFVDCSIRQIEERAFSDSNLSSIIVDDDNLFFRDFEGCLFNKDLSQLICYPTQKKNSLFTVPDGVLTIGNSAFKNNKYLSTVVLPQTLEYIDRHAFEYCDSLKMVSCGACNLKELGWACFSDCRDLESVDFSGTNLTTIQGHAFFNCKKLKFIKSNKINFIGFDAFGFFESDNVNNQF